MNESPDVLTVSFNSAGALPGWIESWGGLARELIVYDNGSEDNSAEVVEDSAAARLIRGGRNIGFGGGVNAAVRSASSDLVLITNPDVLCPEAGSLVRLLEAAGSGRALLSGRMVDPRGNELPAGGDWPGIGWVLAQLFGPARPLGSPGVAPKWLEAGLLLVPRSVFLALDGFDEGFPLYFEDTDLCFRAAQRGYRIHRVEGAVFTHDPGTGAPPSPGIRLPCFHWGLYRFFLKHRGRAAAGTVRLLLIAKCLSRAAALALTPGGSSRARAYLDGASHLLRGKRPDPGAGRA